MSTLKKKVQVVLLPTEGATNIFLSKGELQYTSTAAEYRKQNLVKMRNSEGSPGRHLYFIVNEEIKEPCYAYSKNSNKVEWLTEIQVKWLRKESWLKVIATTNTELKIEVPDSLKQYSQFQDKQLPKPSNSFISKYISEYNKGNIIKEEMVDYEITPMGDVVIEYGAKKEGVMSLKIDKNNCITITRIKDSWSREELQKLFDSYGDNFAAKIIWEDILKL